MVAHDPSGQVRFEAARTLAKVDRNDKKAVPVLMVL